MGARSRLALSITQTALLGAARVIDSIIQVLAPDLNAPVLISRIPGERTIQQPVGGLLQPVVRVEKEPVVVTGADARLDVADRQRNGIAGRDVAGHLWRGHCAIPGGTDYT